MDTPYIIQVNSQKGGVGKTTISVNLATALQASGANVLLIDTDYSNPSVGFHLGLEDANSGLIAVLTGKAKFLTSLLIHNPTGLHVLPGESTTKVFDPISAKTQNELMRFYASLIHQRFDFIIMDTSPGLENESSFKFFKNKSNYEILLVLTPETSACASGVRIATKCAEDHIKYRFILNRIRNKRYELHIDEIEEMCGDKIYASLPEDDVVPISIAAHTPAYLMSRNSGFSASLAKLARIYSSEAGRERFEERRNINPVSRLLNWLFGRGE